MFYRTTRIRVTDVKTDDIGMQQITDFETRNKRPFSEFSVITDRNLFASLEKTSEKIKEEALEGLEPTSLNVALLGTVFGDQQDARAVIEETDKRTQGLYKVGDSVQDAVVKRILREKVVLRVGEKDEILAMKEPSSSRDLTGPMRPGYARSNVGRALPRQFSPGGATITLNRSEIQNAIKDINKLVSEARIQPHFKDGKADGLSISRIQRGSIFSKLGLRNGDVVQEIDGNSLNSPEDVLSLYEKLKSGNQASVQITRRGTQRTLNYRFR